MPRSRITGAITSPLHVAIGLAIRGAALQANRAGVDRFLAERSEALALERHVAPAHFAAHEELLQAIVDAARQAHALEDFAALVLGERRFDRRAAQESVAGVDQLRARLLEPLGRRHARRGFGDAFRRGDVLVQRLRQRATQRGPRRIELHRVAALDGADAGALERLERMLQRKRVTLGDEGGETAGEAGQFGDVVRAGGIGSSIIGLSRLKLGAAGHPAQLATATRSRHLIEVCDFFVSSSPSRP